MMIVDSMNIQLRNRYSGDCVTETKNL